MIAGGPLQHNGLQPLTEQESLDSRKRPSETPAEAAGSTKRTNIGDDHSRIHSAANVTDWHSNHSGAFTDLDWATQSPALSPLGNLWDYLEP
ncbi:hypothetical protein NFI96_016283 [Prochilodus magdalenae]|nr:hypothetical protein NFI96_016283 [Prochilodus magdalenae]